LYWYRSRWYDQSLGRFIQPDTLVPNPGDPVAFDRYHYSRNSPLRYVDPSGHGACSGPYYVPECEETDPDGDGEVPYFSSLPAWQDVPSKEQHNSVTQNMRQETIEIYKQLRSTLLGMGIEGLISDDGKIEDYVILALIIGGEFGIYSDLIESDESNAYLEAKEALSNQYEYYCGGDSCKIEDQLSMLFTMHAFRDDPTIVTSPSAYIDRYSNEARDLIEGFANHDDTSWFWGNIPAADLGRYLTTAVVTTEVYENNGEPKEYFIVYSEKKR
jgi:hypothetical protein